MSRSTNGKPALFSLSILGPPSLTDANGATVTGLGPGKPLAMLSYLAINGPADREELVALLWPEVAEDRARNAFRQTLHRVRAALGAEIVAASREVITAQMDGGLWCDAHEFQQIVARDPISALRLYRGPFLAGLNVGTAPFEQWSDAQRERLEAQYRGALDAAVNAALEKGDLEEAVSLAALLTRVAPLDSEASILEAKVLISAGRKPEAISVLTQHRARLESELGAKPPASVTGLLERLVSDGPVRVSAGTATADLLPEAAFVGREKEVAHLLTLWHESQRRGRTAVITGPAGIGKTRLLREVVQRGSALGPALVLWGQERQGNRTIPYAAIANALRPAVNAPGVAGTSQSLLVEAARLLPEIRDQFNLPDSPPLNDEAARIRFFDGVASLIDAVAFEQPVCIVLEDLHHASTSSVELLHFLTQRLANAPVLFLISFRPSEAGGSVLERFSVRSDSRSAPTSGTPDDSMAHVHLGELDGEAMGLLIASVGLAEEIDAARLSQVAHMATGNPFRALDLLRRARRGEPLAQMPINVSEALWGRLQSCSPPEQRLFLVCALLARPCPLRLLAAATHLTEPQVFDASLGLEQRGLLMQQGGGVAPAHDVTASMALEGSGSAIRALLAGWTADALISERGSANAELGQLYFIAGQPSSAHRYAMAAVLDAAVSGAQEELDGLLSLSLQTALTADDRSRVTSLRTSLLGDSRRLGSGLIDPTDVRGESTAHPDPVDGSQGEIRAPRSDVSQRTRVTRPVRRIAAVAVLGVVSVAAVWSQQTNGVGARRTVLGDSVVVTERVGARGSRNYFVTGPILPAASLTATRNGEGPAWVGELSPPWVNAIISPDDRYVAVERITPTGTDVYVITATQRDTIMIASGAGDDLLAGWSPDARWLLVINGTLSSDGYAAALHAYSIAEPGANITLRTAQSDAVVEAVWSPTGTHVAWTARSGPTRQQDVFVARSDGAGARNVTTNASEDYHPAWSPDGERVVFTSDREGDAELYSVELATLQVRRLTFNPGQDDAAAFSHDGDFIAFESTREGQVGVYAIPPLGGSPRRLTPPGRNFEIAGWRGRRPSYVADLRVAAPATLAPGAAAPLAVTGMDQFGAVVPISSIEWEAVDSIVTVSTASAEDSAAGFKVIGHGRGMGRIVARAGSWRADTAYIMVGTPPFVVLSDDFSSPLTEARWRVLGSPAPAQAAGVGWKASGGLVLHSDRQWESGLLARETIPMRPGLSVTARVRGPFSSTADPGGGFTVALVAAEAPDAIDAAAPQFLRLAAMSWLPDARRMAYSAEREFFSEVAGFLPADDWQTFRITVEKDGRVAFYIGDVLRRRSSIRMTGLGTDTRVQLWIGGRGTGDAVRVDDVKVWVDNVR